VSDWVIDSWYLSGWLLTVTLFTHFRFCVVFFKKNSGLDMVYVFEQESLANAKVSV